MNLTRGAKKARQMFIMKGLGHQKQVSQSKDSEGSAADQLNQVFCRGMGQEAMNENYPKIRDYLNRPNQRRGKPMNSDFGS